MPLAERPWLPAPVAARIAAVEAGRPADPRALAARIAELVAENHAIHDRDCVNLNPATNVMNPKAEALLAAGLGSRASLGYPGDKYETGLEAIEQIEVLAATLAADVFGAPFAEVRVGSGALANLYAFMATCRPGDTIIAPPPAIGGHVTHHAAGAAGLYGLRTLPAPVAAGRYTVDVPALAELAERERPKLITIGGSLNLEPHPVQEIREVADAVGAKVLFDAAHLCGVIAGGQWPNPLAEGAHLMSMSTYKSLGGPPGGLVLTTEAELAERIEAIAYPGLTANFDAGKTAALALTLVDWQVAGADYARAMVTAAQTLVAELGSRDVPVFADTHSHQLAVSAGAYGGGQAAARRLRAGNLLACGIGLPEPEVAGDVNGLRLGTPEIVRIGVEPADLPALAGFIAAALTGDPRPAEVTDWRRAFTEVRYTAG